MLNKVRAICTFIFAFLAFISLDLHVNADTYYYDFEEQTVFDVGKQYVFTPSDAILTGLFSEFPTGSALLKITGTKANPGSGDTGCDQYIRAKYGTTADYYVDVITSGQGFDGCMKGGIVRVDNGWSYFCQAGGAQDVKPFRGCTYKTLEQSLNNKQTPVIDRCTATDIVYGQTLKDSVLSAHFKDEEVEGTLAWATDSIMPTVADSGREYDVIFTPYDTDEYNVVLLKASLNINRQPIQEPYNGTAFVYNGSRHIYTEEASDYYTLSGETSGVDAGDYEISASLKDKYNTCWAGSGKADDMLIRWVINPKSLDDEDIDVSDPEPVTYNSLEQVQSITVRDSGKLLVQGTDYEIFFSDNIDAGVALVRVVGIGNYTDVLEKTFDIYPKSLNDESISVYLEHSP